MDQQIDCASVFVGEDEPARQGYGSGSVFKRGRIWYFQYWASGQQYGPYSSHSELEDDARVLLHEALVRDERVRQKVKTNIIPSNCLRSTIGASSELLVSIDLMNKGYEVFRALSQHASCDLIAMRNGAMIRVEVKTGRLTKQKAPMVSIKRQRGRFDVLAVVNREFGIVYAPPIPTLVKRDGQS